MAVKFLIKDPIAHVLRSAAVGFARRAIQLSGEIDRSNLTKLSIQQETRNRRVMEQTIGAIVVTVASLEGMINEILESASDADYFSRQPPVNVSDSSYRRWARLREKKVFERGNALEKCQLALETADLPSLPEGEGPVQNLNALISLRNSLIHSEPKYRPHGVDVAQKDKDVLEKKLTGKYKDNLLVPKTSPFLWQRCLGAGCARWSIETESTFQNAFFKALGINLTIGEIKWEANPALDGD